MGGSHYGENTLDWDMKNSGGELLANGLYFYRMEAVKQGWHSIVTGKIAVLR